MTWLVRGSDGGGNWGERVLQVREVKVLPSVNPGAVVCPPRSKEERSCEFFVLQSPVPSWAKA
jgi:hypothetical protein